MVSQGYSHKVLKIYSESHRNHFSVEEKTGAMWKMKSRKVQVRYVRSNMLLKIIALQKYLTPGRLDLKH